MMYVMLMLGITMGIITMPKIMNVSRIRICPSLSANSYKYLHLNANVLPKTRPAMNAAMNPFPWKTSASAYAPNASARAMIPSALSNNHPFR